ncbi:hypothetical protein MHU86_25843 [Fragilaria crotonensis]|nr:hypothetical protein MHU86_25843 [Fragilaria crotonensis]
MVGNTASLKSQHPRPLTSTTLQLLVFLVLTAFGVLVSTILLQQKASGLKVEVDVTHDPPRLPPILATTGLQGFNGQVDAQNASIELHVLNDVSTQPALEECLALNSEGWINGPRLGNTRTGGIDIDTAMEMILNLPKLFERDGKGSVHAILKQTICHERSRFLNSTDDGSEGQKSIDFWTLRLIYLSIHMHQHKGAIEEAKLRRDLRCDQILNRNSIGTFDYECPDSKFLVVPMSEMGLGAAMRLGSVNALFAGIATNRTVLFVNNITVGHKSLQNAWAHASCERGDFQCFFMPPTPCTLTFAEIASAYTLNKGEARRMFKFGVMPPERGEDRVIVSNFALRPKHTPPGFLEAILRYADVIIKDAKEATEGKDPRIAVLEKSRAMIGAANSFDQAQKYYYFGVDSRTHHAAVFYSMRPNPYYSGMLDKIHNKIVPADFNAELSFGLPIRASDKCLTESECLSFPQYMKVMGQTWTTHQQAISQSAAASGVTNLTLSIVLTSESQSVLRDMESFESNETIRQNVPFMYQFITNDHDVMQSTGLPKDFMKKATDGSTREDIMLSTISSLRAQLMVKYSVGNCCSNFHLLLFDFLQDGCGAAKDNVAKCLQDNEDPEFRICCMWSKTDECGQKSKALQLQKKQQEVQQLPQS